MGVARNVFPVGTNIGTLVPLIGSYQYSHSVFGCAVTTKLVPPLSVDEYAARNRNCSCRKLMMSSGPVGSSPMGCMECIMLLKFNIIITKVNLSTKAMF